MHVAIHVDDMLITHHHDRIFKVFKDKRRRRFKCTHQVKLSTIFKIKLMVNANEK